MTRARGFTGRVVTYREVAIREFIAGYAYPRNGNVHNPTPDRRWVVGRESFTYLRQAKAAIDEDRAEAQRTTEGR